MRARIEYKAGLIGVRAATVDVRNSSRECSECGHTSKSNRRSQSSFQCRCCSHGCHADINAARVIASRATVNKPNAGARATRKLHLYRFSVYVEWLTGLSPFQIAPAATPVGV
ncbi:MAG: transposase [Blastocatellales bacterium]|nr:transposase [Blastocatellales bacterium]